MTKAYSYLRFSTPEQSKGDSYRRQTEQAAKYAATHGLELDENLRFEDRGVSGFRGNNARNGALGQFLRAIDEGLVEEEAFLLVENLDRVSRQNPWDAMPIFQLIINAGVTIVTLQDNKSWSREELRANPMRIMESLFVMIRANEESATKSRRLQAVWASKRATAGSRRLTKLAPGWLCANESGGFDIIDERAKIVRRIFELSSSGMGKNAIARRMNEEGTSTFGKALHWHPTYIWKLLRNQSVIGTLIPHTLEYIDGRRRRIAQDPVPGYYPAILDEALFQNVQALLVSSAATPRGRQSGQTIRNVLAGLAKCPVCDQTMTRVTKGSAKKAGRPHLVCTKAKTGAGCVYKSVPLEEIEEAIFLEGLGEPPPESELELGLYEEYDQLETEEDVLADSAERLTTELQKASSPSIRERLNSVELRLQELNNAKKKLASRIFHASSDLIVHRLKELSKVLEPTDPEIEKTNRALRQLVAAAVIDYRKGIIQFRWHSGGHSTIRYGSPFPNIRSRSN